MPKKGFKKPSENRREKRVHALFTETEHLQVKASAEAAGLTVSAYLRSTALGQTPKAKPSRVASELVRELNRIGVNLNQFLRMEHRGKTPLDDDMRVCLQQLHEALEKVAS
jgi:hypothetical protein